jgi:hypothetical protein
LINSDIKKSTTNFSYEYGVRYEPKGYTFQTSLKKMQKYYTGDSHYPLKLIISRNLREDLHNKLSFTSPRLDFRDKYIQIRSQNQMGFKRGRFSQVFNLAWNQHLNGRLSSPGLYTGVSLRF